MKTKKKSTTKKATKITREFLFGKRPRALRVRRGDAFDTSAPMWRRFVVMVVSGGRAEVRDVSSGRRRSVRVSRLLAEYVSGRRLPADCRSISLRRWSGTSGGAVSAARSVALTIGAADVEAVYTLQADLARLAPGDRLPLVAVRFVSPEREAAELAWIAEAREQRRRGALQRAMGDWAWDRCKHGGSGACAPCAVDFMVDDTGLRAALPAAETKAAAWAPLVLNIGQVWRVPVGPSLDAFIRAREVMGDNYQTSHETPTAAPPVRDFYCCGSEYGRGRIEHALLSPMSEDGKRSRVYPRIALPVAYLIEHGARV